MERCTPASAPDESIMSIASQLTFSSARTVAGYPSRSARTSPLGPDDYPAGGTERDGLVTRLTLGNPLLCPGGAIRCGQRETVPCSISPRVSANRFLQFRGRDNANASSRPRLLLRQRVSSATTCG